MKVDIPEDVVNMLEGTPYFADSTDPGEGSYFVYVTPRKHKKSSEGERSRRAHIIVSGAIEGHCRARLFENGGAVPLQLYYGDEETWEDMLRLCVQRLLLGEMRE